jgi:hypothetical protein
MRMPIPVLDFSHPKWDYERPCVGFHRSGSISGGLDKPDIDGARNLDGFAGI